MRAAIYTRISEDREGAGLGVERQRADCVALCAELGWEVDGLYSDNDLSAYSGKPRPEYERLLKDAESKPRPFEAIVAWHTDRLHRSPAELERFITLVEGQGLALRMVKGGDLDLSTPSGRMIARQLGSIARYESEHKAERVQRKMDELPRPGSGAVAGRGRSGTTPAGWCCASPRPRSFANLRRGC